MSVFVDSSAIVAILAEEQGAEELAARLELLSPKCTSPISVYEATLAVCRIFRIPPEAAENVVMEFLGRSGIVVVEIPAVACQVALSAHARYGKGMGNAAQLNLGDCFTYAMTKLLGYQLLYKGADFAQTDLA